MSKLKLIICGYGKMGKAVEKIANTVNIDILSIISRNDHDKYSDLNAYVTQNRDIVEQYKETIVGIDFTSADGFIENLQQFAKYKVPLVTGSTGWENRMEFVKKIVEKSGISFLYGSNFSIGVHLFWKIIAYATKIISATPQSQYDVAIHELHHNTKKDSPSGTALTTGNLILQNCPTKNSMVLDTLSKRSPLKNELHISATRIGTTIGEHSVRYDSAFDLIKIEHIAKNRDMYANGAIQIAEWLKDQRGGIFIIDDYLDVLMKQYDQM